MRVRAWRVDFHKTDVMARGRQNRRNFWGLGFSRPRFSHLTFYIHSPSKGRAGVQNLHTTWEQGHLPRPFLDLESSLCNCWNSTSSQVLTVPPPPESFPGFFPISLKVVLPPPPSSHTCLCASTALGFGLPLSFLLDCELLEATGIFLPFSLASAPGLA